MRQPVTATRRRNATSFAAWIKLLCIRLQPCYPRFKKISDFLKLPPLKFLETNGDQFYETNLQLRHIPYRSHHCHESDSTSSLREVAVNQPDRPNVTAKGNIAGVPFFSPAAKSMLLRLDALSEHALAGNPSIRMRIGPGEASFVAERDSFHLASIGEDGWPYTQHHRGPKGFLRTLDETTLAFVGLRNIRRNISAGNVLLLLMDYSSQERLKIWANNEVSEDPTVIAKLTGKYDSSPAELAFVFRVRALGWNSQPDLRRSGILG